jgi:hypothetical protein
MASPAEGGFQERVEEDSGIHVDAVCRERLNATPLAGEGVDLFDASVRSPEWTKLVGTLYTRAKNNSKDDIEMYEVNEVVLDLVMMATTADREDKGGKRSEMEGKPPCLHVDRGER